VDDVLRADAWARSAADAIVRNAEP
jgi:hypothetical protein